MKKRIITVIMALALVLGTFYTGSPVTAYAANEDMQDNMTDVILKIKTKLELPDEYTVFSNDYYNSGQKGTWYFNWSTEDSSKTVNVTCDDDARIISMSCYNNENNGTMPDVTADELLDTANELLERLFPEAKGHVVLKNTYCMYYRSAYRFNFNRIENGIEMPDNHIMISVSYTDGSLVNADCSWNYTSKVPSAKKIISAEEAKKNIDKTLEMNLRYYVSYDSEGKEKIFLAYTPSMSYIATDAKSGKIYDKKDYWGDDAKNAYDEDVAAESADTNVNGRGYEAKLSDAEIKKIADLENLISSDDAVKIIKNNKYLLIDEKATSVTSSLREYDGKYTWYITLRDNRPADYDNNDYYRAYANASVDASSGKILNYYSSLKSLYYYSQEEIDGISFNYSKKDCKKIFEDFVKEIESERFGKVKLENSSPSMSTQLDGTGKTIDLAYGFNYTRYHEGIPFASNGINGSVDRITGKVYSYNVNWSDAEVPSSKGIISESKAYDAYMNYEGFDLVYEIVTTHTDSGTIYGYDNQQVIRLVYRTAISPYFVDAFTGKQLSYNGEEYEKARTDYQYNDIAGTKYEKAIKILAGLGVGLPGESFEPDKAITKAELKQLSNNMPYLGYRNYEETQKSDNKALTRQQAAKEIIDVLGLGFIAKLDIYKLSYSDASKVSKKLKGYVALAGALGLFETAKSGKFEPKAAFTRGEAAQLLLNSVSVILENQN